MIRMPKKQVPFKIGKKYLIRTVSYFTVGLLDFIVGDFLVMSQTSWVADTGRFSEALETGKLSEVEVTGETYVNLNAVVDAFVWEHELPSKTT